MKIGNTSPQNIAISMHNSLCLLDLTAHEEIPAWKGDDLAGVDLISYAQHTAN